MEYENQSRLWSLLLFKVTWARPFIHCDLNFCSNSQFHSRKSEKGFCSLWAEGKGL